MASLTIRKIEESLKTKLRVHAARQGRSMEEAAREILRTALAGTGRQPGNLAEAIRRRFEPLGGIEVEPPLREPLRDPPFSR